MDVEVMRCERQAMTLTRTGCSRLYLSAAEKAPAAWEGRAKCVGCPIGAALAGKPPPSAAALAAPVGSRWCVRCQRNAERVIKDRLCLSCYNRQREALAAGVPDKVRRKPGVSKLRADLAQRTFTIATEGRVRRINSPLVRDTREALESIAIHVSGPMTIGRRAMRWPVEDDATVETGAMLHALGQATGAGIAP